MCRCVCAHTVREMICATLVSIQSLICQPNEVRSSWNFQQDWSPELINNVRRCAHAPVHAQCVKTCTQQSSIWPTTWDMRVCILPQVVCMFSRAVSACMHMHTHKHYLSAQETNLEICWKFHEEPTSFGWVMFALRLTVIHYCVVHFKATKNA